MLKRYEALRIVRDYSFEIWRETLGSEEHAAIVEIFKWPDLTPVHVSRTLNYGTNPYAEFVDELQSNDEAALALADRLGLPSLDFEDGSALVRHLDSLKKTADVPDFCEVTPADIDEFQLAPGEFDVVEILARELLDRQLPFIHWAAGFESGGRFLASCLPVHPRAASRYRRFFVIGPSSLIAPFELELKKVASELGITPGGGSLAVSLLTALQEHHALLIICGIDAVDNNKRLKLASVFRDLLDAAKDLGTVPAGKLTPLLYVGQAKAPRHVQRYPVLADIDAANAVPSVDRSEMFYVQWLRFTKRRGFDPAGEIGSRLRRAEWHYDDIRSRTVSPISIRVRAFFASNLDNYAFFDPTSGFKALAGSQPELPRDVAFFVDDVQRHLRLLKQDRPKRNPELRMLRAVSTAKYWLTPEALADLLDSSIEEAMEEGKALDLLEIDGQAKNPDVNPGEKHYVLNIGVKALIQDHWRAADAADVVDDADAFRSRSDRSIAHLKVAKRLHEKRTDRQILSKEFPFDPHWGRHRIHIVSEVLRHLVRACDTAPLELRPPLKERMVDEAGFPSKLVDGATYCDPRVIINFCFKELYRKELNGDETRFRRRELTKLHGAYVLAMELFQLMSQPGQFGMPHWALDSQYHKSFRLEAGYAALNVGQFPQATYCFCALVEQAEQANDPLGQADALLHLTLSQLAQYDLAGAAQTINIVERKLSDVQAIDDGLHEHWLKSLKGRVARRKAHLLYLRGDHVRALRELVDIFGVDDEAPAIDKPELATIFIDLLERNEIRDEVSEAIGKPLQDALGVCSLVMFRAMSAGLQHEAMRYKIAFARLLRGRNLRVAAENVLDGVHVDIANYGCSERTYLAFLLEAGDTLLADGRPVRAVVTYLAGCAERAAARGFWREWESAVDLSLTALRAALEKARIDAEAWDRYLETEVAAEQRYRKKDLPNKVGPFARDPLWGYSLTDSDAQYEIARFKPDYIEEKIAELTSAKASQSQAMERRTGRAATST